MVKMEESDASSKSGAPPNPIRFAMRSEYRASALDQLANLRETTAL
jgi:hypothetical protein